MLPKTLTSLQHPLVGYCQALRKERPFREQEKKVLVSGETLIRELSAKTPPLVLFTSQESSSLHALEHYLVTPALLKKITGLEEPDGYAALFPLPPPQDLRSKSFLLLLDQLADPGNLGTLLRTALALNWDGVITTPGTVDLFNDKALRAAKGATFHLPYMHQTPSELIQWIGDRHLFLADVEGAALSSSLFSPPLLLILSSEAHGPQEWCRHRAEKISIPMNPAMESLNVASAGAILLFAMRPS